MGPQVRPLFPGRRFPVPCLAPPDRKSVHNCPGLRSPGHRPKGTLVTDTSRHNKPDHSVRLRSKRVLWANLALP